MSSLLLISGNGTIHGPVFSKFVDSLTLFLLMLSWCLSFFVVAVVVVAVINFFAAHSCSLFLSDHLFLNTITANGSCFFPYRFIVPMYTTR